MAIVKVLSKKYRGFFALFLWLSMSSFAINNDHQRYEQAVVKFIITPKVDKATQLPEGFADTLVKVERILSKIFSSDELRVALAKKDFPDSSFSKSKKGCFQALYDSNGRVSGLGLYQNLTQKQAVELEWVIKPYPKGKTSTMGFSNACVDRITSYDYWIKDGQFLSLRMVRHLAHEFTHIVGYRHASKVPEAYKWTKKEDPAYVLGGIVGDIMLDWIKKGAL